MEHCEFVNPSDLEGIVPHASESFVPEHGRLKNCDAICQQRAKAAKWSHAIEPCATMLLEQMRRLVVTLRSWKNLKAAKVFAVPLLEDLEVRTKQHSCISR